MNAEVTLNLSELCRLPALLVAIQQDISALRRDLAPAKPPPERKLFYTKQEAADVLNVSQTTVDRYIRRKLLRKCKATGKVLISVDDLKTFASRTI